MSILWCGGEDIDFSGAVSVSTSASNFRAGYGRCSLLAVSTGGVLGNAFPGGAVTSCWLAFHVQSISTTPTTGTRIGGLGRTGTTGMLGLAVSAANQGKVALIKYDGTTATELAVEGGSSLGGTIAPHRFDIQVSSYGATATVNVYCDGFQIITFTGSVLVAGGGAPTDLNCAALMASSYFQCSEFIVADEDTRAFPGLVTLALTGAGTTDNWTASTFGNINGTTISDTNPMSSNTNAQESMFNVTDLPAGSFVIKACKLSARSAKSSSPAVTKVQLGWANVSGTSGYTNAAVAVTTGYATYEQLDGINPITGVAFVQSEMNALQASVKSAT